MDTKLILVGGFLGAGKTTLLWEASQRLAQPTDSTTWFPRGRSEPLPLAEMIVLGRGKGLGMGVSA